MRRIGYRYQRTLAASVEVQGIGFLTGADVTLRFSPAPPATGIVFIRVDQRARPCIAATAQGVTGTQRRTTLGSGSAQVGLVEHVLSALYALRIDNCSVEVNAPEPPGMDGSAQGFVQALASAGVVLQGARRAIYTVDSTITLSQGPATLSLHPNEDSELKLTYLLDYGPNSPIDRQRHTQVITAESFKSEIAPCRTFLLEKEAFELRKQGLGSRTKLSDLLVFGPAGVIDNKLHFANEPARHKVLDMLGDLALFGHDLRGHLVAYRSGHPLNVALAKELCELVSVKPALPAPWRCAA